MRTSVIILAGAAGLAAVLPAQAIERYTITNMTCASVQAALRHDGAAILRHSSAGLPIYDRYVGNTMHCLSPEVAKPASVPASDNAQCAVLKCEPVSVREEIRIETPNRRTDSDD